MRIIWILGSMASGKTTQHRLLLSLLGKDGELETIQDLKSDNPYCFNISGEAASLGLLKEGVQTGGIDPVYSQLKKEGLNNSINRARAVGAKTIVVEGAQASWEWYKQVLISTGFDIFVVHLAISFDDNLNRLRKRRWVKSGGSVETFSPEKVSLDNKAIESIIGKNKQYINLFAKLTQESDVKAIEIDARLGEFDIVEKILNFVLE